VVQGPDEFDPGAVIKPAATFARIDGDTTAILCYRQDARQHERARRAACSWIGATTWRSNRLDRPTTLGPCQRLDWLFERRNATPMLRTLHHLVRDEGVA